MKSPMRIIPWKWLFFVSLAFNLSVLFSFAVFQSLENKPHANRKSYQYPLTPRQQQQIQSIREAYRRDVGTIRQELKQSRKALWQTLASEQPDASRLDSLKHRITQLDYELRQYIYQYYIQEMLVLTPEQRQERLKDRLTQP